VELERALLLDDSPTSSPESPRNRISEKDVAFSSLAIEQANEILTEADGSLDNGSPFGVFFRLNLYAAAAGAALLTSSAPPSVRRSARD
jgi:hypothetical protein